MKSKHMNAIALGLAVAFVGCSSTPSAVQIKASSMIQDHQNYISNVGPSKIITVEQIENLNQDYVEIHKQNPTLTEREAKKIEKKVVKNFKNEIYPKIIRSNADAVSSISTSKILKAEEIAHLKVTRDDIKKANPTISEKECNKIYQEQIAHYTKVVYPAIIEKQSAIIENTVTANLEKSSNGNSIRNWCWNTIAEYKEIPELYQPLRLFVINQINTVINPYYWEKTASGIDPEFNALFDAKKYEEAINFIKDYTSKHKINGYSSKLDKELEDISKELTSLGIDSKDLDKIAIDTQKIIYDSDNLVDKTDTTTKKTSSKVVENGEDYSPDLKRYNSLIKDYRETLKKYDVTEKQIDEIISYYTDNAALLIEKLVTRKESVESLITTESMVIGSHAYNLRLDTIRDAYVLKVNVARLTDPYTNLAKILEITRDTAVNEEYLKILESDLKVVVSKLVKEGKFAEARNFAWNLCATDKEEINSRLRPLAFEMLLKEVNPANWKVIEKDVTANVDKLVADGKIYEAIDFVKGYPRVETFSSDISSRVANTMAELKKLGYSDEELANAEAYTKEQIARSANILCEIDKIETVTEAQTSEGEKSANREAFTKSLDELKKALIKHDCTEANAQAIVDYLNTLAKTTNKAATEKEILLLGTMSINNRLNMIANDLIEQSDKLVMDSLIAQVKAAVDKNDFDTARALIRDVKFFATERDIKIYALRVGLLNSLVNPFQYKYLAKQIDADMKKFIDTNDFAGLKKYVENYPYVHDNYQQIATSLEALATAMVETKWVSENNKEIKTKVSNEIVNELAKTIQKILENRAGEWTDELPSLEVIEKALADIDSSLVAQYYNPEHISQLLSKTKTDIKNVVYTGVENITTYELNEKLRAKLNISIDKSLESSNGKTLDDMIAISEIKNEISFESQIAIAKDAIKEEIAIKENKSIACSALQGLDKDVNNLLGEYARIMRLLAQNKEISAAEATSLVIGAAFLDQPEVVEFAKKLDANLNGVSTRDPIARTPILLAIEAGNVNMISTLTKLGSSFDAVDSQGNTTLHYAVESGNLAMVNVVMKEVDANIQNANGETALFVAVRNNNADQIKLLATVNGINLNIKNNAGASAIDIACELGCLDALNALASVGVKFDVQQLVIAAKFDQLGIAQWLITNGVDVNGNNVMSSVVQGSKTEEYLILEGGIPAARNVENTVTEETTPSIDASTDEKIVGKIDLTITSK